MKISLRLLSSFGMDLEEYKADPKKLADLLTNAGLEVEEIQNQSLQFKNVVIGKIIEKNKHPNADSLTLCQVDTGDKIRHIVCGAKNHNAGDKVIVALPGAVLPGNFAIKVSKIRGEESEGMLCSEKELGLKGTSDGIIILPEQATVGDAFAKYYKLDDVVFDVKITPNRADCLSHFGIIREISALTGKTFDQIMTPFNEGRESTKKLVKVTVEDQERCLRYSGRLIKNVKIKPSPDWLLKALESLGMRSINNVVDITNYILMTLGQPLHAFDFAKIRGGQLIVRAAQPGEKLKTLRVSAAEEKEITFENGELIIADSEGPVALAGVMGGFDTGVTESTTDVFIESAIFNAASVRRTSKFFGINSDSSYRFARGVDPDGVLLALNRCCQLLADFAEGTVCADSYDIYPRPLSRPRIELDLKFISARLGFTVETNEARKVLERLGCTINGSGDKLLVNPPAYRMDLKLQEDLGEEILRIKGFAQIPETLPAATSEPTPSDKDFLLEQRLIELFAGLGFNQAVNLSLTSSEFEEKVLGKIPDATSVDFGIDLRTSAIKIINPLNNDLDILRRAIFPSLLKNILHNTRYGVKHGQLFEIAPVFANKKSGTGAETEFYQEESHLGLCRFGEATEQWDGAFFKVKGALENFLKAWSFKSFKFQPFANAPEFLHPGQSAQIIVEGKPVGFIGVIHPTILDVLDFKIPVVVAEIGLKNLFASQPRLNKSKDVPKFPSMERDVALLVPNRMLASDVQSELKKAAGQLAVACEIFDLYAGANLPPEFRSLAFRITYLEPTRTLVDEEVNALHQKAIQAVCLKLQLSVR